MPPLDMWQNENPLVISTQPCHAICFRLYSFEPGYFG